MVELFGGSSLADVTYEYITDDDLTSSYRQLRRTSELWDCMDHHLDIARALWDRNSLAAHLDVKYVNIDYPAEACVGYDQRRLPFVGCTLLNIVPTPKLAANKRCCVLENPRKALSARGSLRAGRFTPMDIGSRPAACLLLFPVISAFATVYTSQAGSEERKAICNGLREYIVRRVATRPLPQPIVFRVGILRVEGEFAWFEGLPMFKSGASAMDYLSDVGYFMVLKRSGGEWRVAHDLSRSDVPSESEIAALHKELATVPSSIFSDFWRQLLRR